MRCLCSCDDQMMSERWKLSGPSLDDASACCCSSGPSQDHAGSSICCLAYEMQSQCMAQQAKAHLHFCALRVLGQPQQR